MQTHLASKRNWRKLMIIMGNNGLLALPPHATPQSLNQRMSLGILEGKHYGFFRDKMALWMEEILHALRQCSAIFGTLSGADVLNSLQVVD